MKAAPERYPVSIDVPVAWGEMDAFAHVNNTVFVRWIESARIVYFDRVGMLERMRQDGVGPIQARTEIDYLRPVVWPDRVRVEVSVTRIGGKSFVMTYRIWSEAQEAEVARAETVIVMFDYRANRSVPVSDELRRRIEALEASATGERTEPS